MSSPKMTRMFGFAAASCARIGEASAGRPTISAAATFRISLHMVFSDPEPADTACPHADAELCNCYISIVFLASTLSQPSLTINQLPSDYPEPAGGGVTIGAASLRAGQGSAVCRRSPQRPLHALDLLPDVGDEHVRAFLCSLQFSLALSFADDISWLDAIWLFIESSSAIIAI